METHQAQLREQRRGIGRGLGLSKAEVQLSHFLHPFSLPGLQHLNQASVNMDNLVKVMPRLAAATRGRVGAD